MQDFLELAVSATASGCVYGLMALAYLLMIRPTGIINFAVGEWAMVASFGGFVFLTKYEWPYPAGMAVVIAFMLAVGWVTERVTVRPLVERGAPVLAPILALLGVLVVTREIISLSFPPDPLPVPFPFGIGRLEIGPVGGSYQNFFIIALTLAVFAGAWLFFEKTLWGRSFEAVALNRRAAALMGINLARVTAFSFAAGAAVAGLAGLLVSPNISAHYLMGVPLAIQGFTALVIGGVGRVEGALLGGLVLAFAEQLTARYAPIPSGFAQGVPLLFLMIFLLLRPSGLLRARA
ncbi:MAG TPA: branched-chain amino acid ABC transporter permease [Burkholderiales bacterium]|nr:branched-chain amino acid ABC transporter permease [Burkholderiales bacterium]